MKAWRVSRFVAVIVLLVLSLFVPGCGNRSTTNPYEYSDFTKLDIQNAFDIEITQSGTYGILITSSEALLDYLSVVKEGDTLVIKIQPNHVFTDFVTMRKTLKARISMPVVRSIKLSGACNGTLKGFESTEALDLDISGASTLNLSRIETGNVAIVVSGESKVYGKLTAANVEFDVSGGSKVDLTGTGSDCQILASGAARMNLEFFVNQTSTVTLNGSSQVTLDTRQHLDFSLTGASRLFFLSNPNTGKMEVLGASTVKHK
jgi:hypothetical protein